MKIFFLSCCICSSSSLFVSASVGGAVPFGLTWTPQQKFQMAVLPDAEIRLHVREFQIQSRYLLICSVLSLCFNCMKIFSADKLFCYSLNIDTVFLSQFPCSNRIDKTNKTSDDKFGLSSSSLLSDVYFSLMECLISSFKSVWVFDFICSCSCVWVFLFCLFLLL